MLKGTRIIAELEYLVLEFLTPDGMERSLIEELISLKTSIVLYSMIPDHYLSPLEISLARLGTVENAVTAFPKLEASGEVRFWRQYLIKERRRLVFMLTNDQREANRVPLRMRMQWNFNLGMKQMAKLV